MKKIIVALGGRVYRSLSCIYATSKWEDTPELKCYMLESVHREPFFLYPGTRERPLKCTIQNISVTKIKQFISRPRPLLLLLYRLSRPRKHRHGG